MNQYDKQLNKDIDQHAIAGGQDHGHDRLSDRQQLRRNPRLVIGTLDYFALIMEQEEQK